MIKMKFWRVMEPMMSAVHMLDISTYYEPREKALCYDCSFIF